MQRHERGYQGRAKLGANKDASEDINKNVIESIRKRQEKPTEDFIGDCEIDIKRDNHKNTI